jgi:hypothetical protein
LLVVVVIVTSVAFFYVETKNGKREQALSYYGTLYQASNATMGKGTFNAKSIPGRIISTSTSFLCIVVLGGYTANLASNLVAQKSSQVNNLEDAVNRRMEVCLNSGSSHEDFFKAVYKDDTDLIEGVEANIDVDSDMKPIFDKLKEGECDVGLVSKAAYNSAIRDSELNGDCNLQMVGSIIAPSEASFPIASSAENCSYLIRDVFNIHLLEMKEKIENGTRKLDEIFGDYHTENDLVCPEDLANENRLGIFHFAGILILHAIVLFSSIVYTFGAKRTKQWGRNISGGDEKKESIRSNDEEICNNVSQHQMKVLLEHYNSKQEKKLAKQQQELLSTLQTLMSSSQKSSEQVPGQTLARGAVDDQNVYASIEEEFSASVENLPFVFSL